MGFIRVKIRVVELVKFRLRYGRENERGAVGSCQERSAVKIWGYTRGEPEKFMQFIIHYDVLQTALQ